MHLQIRYIFQSNQLACAAIAVNHFRLEWAAAELAALGSSNRLHIGHSYAAKTGLQINMLGVCPRKEDKEQS